MANKPFRAIADRPELVAALAGKADGARFLGFTRQIVAVDEADRFAKAGAAQDGDLWFQPVAGAPADTTAPAAPTAFSSTAGNAQNVLAWTNPTAPDFAGVKVLRKAGGYPATITDGTVVYTGVGTGYTDVGRTNGVADFYAIFAFDAVPNYSAPATATSTPTLGNVAPAAFTPVVSAITATGCTVTASTTDANSDPLTYKYAVTTSATPPADWTAIAAFTSPQAVTGLTASTPAYYAHVRAFDGSLATVGTSTSFATAAAPDVTLPVLTGALSAVAQAGGTSVLLDWPDATDNVGVNGYDVEYGTTNAYGSIVTDPTASTVLITGMLGTTLYYFRVRAHDAAGNVSAWLTTTTTTTATAVVYTEPFDSLAAWTKTYTAGATATIVAGRFHLAEMAEDAVYRFDTPGTALTDVLVQGKVFAGPTNAARAMLFARAGGANCNDGYCARYEFSNKTLNLLIGSVNPVGATVTLGAHPTSVGVKVTGTGSSTRLTAYVDGAPNATLTDIADPAGTYVSGAASVQGYAATAIFEMDDFTVQVL